MKHLPDEAYWRLNAEINNKIDGNEQMEIFHEERKLMKELEIENYKEYNK